MLIIEIEVMNWEKHQPKRNDVKRPTWFKLHHDLFEHEEFWDFTREELCFFMYVLCQTSKQNKPVIKLNVEKAVLVGRFEKSVIQSTLRKLEEIQTVKVLNKKSRNVRVTCTARTRNVDGTSEKTREEENRREEIRVDKTETVGCADLHPLALVWNKYSGIKLPKVLKCDGTRLDKARSRWRENPGEDYWVKVIEKINASPFCNGNNTGGWVANFDFLIKPDTGTRALEGQYDAHKGTAINWDYVFGKDASA